MNGRVGVRKGEESSGGRGGGGRKARTRCFSGDEGRVRTRNDVLSSREM